MEKTKLLTIAIVSLLLINIGTLSFLWFAKPGRPPMGGGAAQEQALAFLMAELKYDDQQRQQCVQILKEHRRNMDRIRTAIRQQHNEVFDNLAHGDTTKLAAIGDLYHQNELEVFHYFTALRNVSREDQREKFDHIINEAMRIMPPTESRPPH